MRENPQSSACDGKYRYPDPQTAAKVARKRPETRHYRCPYCGGWHIGGIK